MKRLCVFTIIALAWVSIAHADLMDGLVLYMPLDEGSGKTTKDLAENGFEGTLMGSATWVSGKFSKALQFKASSDFVSIKDNKALHISDAITQAAWIKLDRLPSAHAIVFGTRNDGAPGRKIVLVFVMS